MCVEHEPCRALLFEALYRRLRLSMLDGTELFAILRRFWYVNVEYVSVRSIPHCCFYHRRRRPDHYSTLFHHSEIPYFHLKLVQFYCLPYSLGPARGDNFIDYFRSSFVVDDVVVSGIKNVVRRQHRLKRRPVRKYDESR